MPSSDHNEREIFGRLNVVDKTLARIDERTERMDREWRELRNDHEKRIQTLELKEAKRGGILTALAAAASVLASGITWLLSHLFGRGN